MSVVVIRSAALLGVDALPIDVEVSLSQSLPGIKTLGLPDAAMREGTERVVLALKNSHILGDRPAAVVNLAPAEMRKSGAAYELPIAAGLMVLKGLAPPESLARLLVVGELGLGGDVRAVRGVIAMALLARDSGARAIVVPAANAREAALVSGIDVLPVASLRELLAGLRGEPPMAPYCADPEADTRDAARLNVRLPDFSEVRGQSEARRAAEIAAAGGHNLLFLGPPGSGKTMIARRLAGLLPQLSTEEALETTRIHSAAGLLREGSGLLRVRPFRAPHHSISSAGLIGGYFPPRPGEVSLAHHGVLFLDEMAEFSRASLEALREPVEDGRVCLARGGVSVSFPSRTMLIAATNPCPCGYHGDPVRPCACTPGAIARYRRRLSGPLLDRIDLHVDVPRLSVAELTGGSDYESSSVISARVAAARALAQVRLAPHGVMVNAALPDRVVRDEVRVPARARADLERAIGRLGLSPRAYIRILRVARTIADLSGAQGVETDHVLESLQYRALDRREP